MLARFLPGGILRDKAFFDLWQEHGYHITPVHFYEPVPDTRTLSESLWTDISTLPGIRIDDRSCLNRLREFKVEFYPEYTNFPKEPGGDPSQFFLENGFLGPGDAEILYCMARHLKPRQVLEIGSGYSTLLLAGALEVNRKEGCGASQYRCIDPYPKDFVAVGVPGLDRLIKKPLEEMGWEPFEALGENDILFIDSSHVVRIGGDVNRLILETLPRLRAGVVVHFHDILLPEEYPEPWVRGMARIWSEQYLLQAFMAFNDSFEILWPGNYMRVKHRQAVEEAIPSFRADKTWLGSFWIRKTR
jgi:hypothetical protein